MKNNSSKTVDYIITENRFNIYGSSSWNANTREQAFESVRNDAIAPRLESGIPTRKPLVITIEEIIDLGKNPWISRTWEVKLEINKVKPREWSIVKKTDRKDEVNG